MPVNANPTAGELKRLLRFFNEHDDLAREIAERGRNHIWDHLRMKDIHCYWRKLLRKYAKLLRFDVKLDPNLIEIH